MPLSQFYRVCGAAPASRTPQYRKLHALFPRGLPSIRFALAFQLAREAAAHRESRIQILAGSLLLSGETFMNNPGILQRFRFVILLLLAVITLATAQSANADEGQFQILRARYGTANHFVDVTPRLKELPPQHFPFPLAHPTFSLHPDPPS